MNRRGCFRLVRSLAAVLILAFAISNAAAQQVQQVQYVGIPSQTMNYFAASQHGTQWCWAAAIQMVLNYYGVPVSQEQIVARTYGVDPLGRLPDWAADPQRMTQNLNNWSIDNRGQPYGVSATWCLGAPATQVLISELSQGRPVIVGYRSSPTTSHAVVVTGASWTPSFNGPIVQTLIVRDPSPSPAIVQNLGRIEYPGATLAQCIQNHWYVRAYRLQPGQDHRHDHHQDHHDDHEHH